MLYSHWTDLMRRRRRWMVGKGVWLFLRVMTRRVAQTVS